MGEGELFDASLDGDAGTVIDAGADVDPLSPPLGTIVVHEVQDWQIHGTTYLPYIDAQFSPPSVNVTGAKCISTKPTAQCGFPPTCYFPPPPVGAGTLTIAGGLFGSGVDVAEGDAALFSYQFQGKQTYQSFNAGEVLTATGSGAQVPPFTAQVTVPADITLLTPPLPWVIPSGQDLTFTWSGGESGSFVSIVFDSMKVPLGATCTFDATAGTGTIPHDALGGVTGTVVAEVMVIRDARTWAGDYPIDFQIQRTRVLTLTIE